MKPFGPNELLQDVINKKLCIGCGACIHLCPYFRSYRGRTAMIFPCTKSEGRCWAYCPKVEVDLDALSQNCFGGPYTKDALGYYRSIHMSRAGSKAKIKKGAVQAGGTVSALMSFALAKGLLDAAVLTGKEGLLPVPRIVTDAREALRVGSSKYAAAPTLAALNQAIKEGYKKIGVVGTPCQVLAVARMRTNPMDDPAFVDPFTLVVGLFCTWSIDFRLFEPFLAKRVAITEITKVDIPPPPSEIMEVYAAGEKIEIPLGEVRELVPDTCSYCIDMTSEFSDLSVGVLEGRPDMNTLIIRTERGERIVNDAVKGGFLVMEAMPAENLEHLVWAAGNKKKRAFVKAGEAGMVNTSEGTRSYLRVNPRTCADIIG